MPLRDPDATALPAILVTLADPSRTADAAAAMRKNGRYLEAVRRAGGEPVGIDARSTPGEREAAFERMAALLLSGGADIDPVVYGQPTDGARTSQPERDTLELGAFRAAMRRAVPVLGICRGLQAINAFCGGTLVQHVDDHQGPEYGHGEAHTHDLEVLPDTRLARILALGHGPAAGGRLTVNSYHHQAVTPQGLAPGLRASAVAPHAGATLIEGLETDGDQFLIGIQCHPERTESTPPELERLFAAFVAEARRPAGPAGA